MCTHISDEKFGGPGLLLKLVAFLSSLATLVQLLLRVEGGFGGDERGGGRGGDAKEEGQY